MALGPWNTPPNFLAAMSGGASAGLQARGQDITARGQDIAAGEAADRLAMAYQQLAGEEQARAQAAKEKMDIATAANAIKAQQIDMLNQWHQAQVAAERAKLAQPDLHFGTEGEITSVDPTTGALTQIRAPRQATVTPYQQAQLDLANKRAGQLESYRQAQLAARKGRLSDVQKALLGSDVTELRGLEKQIGGTEEHGFGVLHPFGGNKSQMDALRKRAADLRQKIQSEYGTSPDTSGPSQFAPAPLDAKQRESGTTYMTPKGPHTWTGYGWKPVAPTPTPTDEGDTSDEEDTNAE